MRLRRARTPVTAVGVLAAALLGGAPTTAATAASAATAAPSVSSLSPSHGLPRGGTTVSISGHGFTRTSTVRFGYYRSPRVSYVSSTLLRATTPARANGTTVDVRVTTGRAASAITTRDRFRYLAVPAVTRVSPAGGATTGCGQVTITGSGFTGATGVRFGSLTATGVRVVSDTSIIVTRPPAARAGSVDVRVLGPAGTSPVTSRDRCTYAAPQVIHVGGQLAGRTVWSPGCSAGYQLDSTVTVPAGASLTIAAGTTVRATSSAGLVVDGSLAVSGSATAPVVLTSTTDVAGGAPHAGDWAGITVGTGGWASLTGIDLRYAATGLDVAGGAVVGVRGRIVDDTVGVRSDDSVVDARDVDWGSDSGPSPIGGGTPVSGAGVFATPWVGWVRPTRPGTTVTSRTAPGDTSCDPGSVLFIGVRGSGEGPQGMAAVNDPATTDQALLGGRVPAILDAMTTRLTAEAGAAAPHVRVLGLRYPAAPPPYASFAATDDTYTGSIWAGVDELEYVISRESERCAGTGQRIVLAGYSQGALVIRLALADLAAKGTLDPTIAAVELVGDPAASGPAAPALIGGAQPKAEGIWTTVMGQAPIPASLVAHTTSFCHHDDAVCEAADPGSDGRYRLDPTASGGPHSTYPQGSELDPLGDAAADAVLG